MGRLRVAFQIEGEQGRRDGEIRVSWTQPPPEAHEPVDCRSLEYNSWVAGANARGSGEVKALEAVVQPRRAKLDQPLDRSSRAMAERCYT